MAEQHLVCEGPVDGCDGKVLDALVAQSLSVPVIIQAAGGDRSVRSVRAWLEAKYGALVISIEDRNYRPLAQSRAAWADPDCKCLIWHRHEIENYLLQPEVLLAAFNSFRATVPAGWPQRLPDSIGRTEDLLRRLARPLLLQHAACVVHSELQGAVRAEGVLGLALPKLPRKRSKGKRKPDEWISALQLMAKRLRHTCARVANMGALAESWIKQRYETVVHEVRAEEFLSSSRFLVDLGGHELLRQLHRYSYEVGAKRLSLSDLLDELVKAIQQVYPGKNLFQPDEFQMLSSRFQR